MTDNNAVASLQSSLKSKRGSLYRDIGMFLSEWAGNPLRVASVVPSSKSLASLITSEITTGPFKVVEFGPGTGVFTQALIERGIAEEQLVLVENGKRFVDLLRQRYPRAMVMEGDAADFWKRYDRTHKSVGAMISGLPLLSMSTKKVAGVLKSISEHMMPGGGFYQFTYGVDVPVSRKLLGKMGMDCRRIGGTLVNFPPASVYRISHGM